MNKKKYISIGVFFVVIALGVGIAYDVAPSEINNVLGINSGATNPVVDADLSAINAASSSFFSSDTATEESDAPSAPSPMKKQTEDGKIATTAAQEAAVASSQNENVFPTDTSGQETISPGDENATPTSSTTAALPLPTIPCSFPADAPSTTKEIILNEIAWMGSASSSDAEWMELKNNSEDAVDLSGWELVNASAKIKVSFAEGDTVAPEGFFLLARASAAGIIPGAKIYSGDLTNAGDTLALMDPQCNVSDYLDASHGWPAGDNTTKATMERDADDNEWHTSTSPGGTPGAENSAGAPPPEYRLTIAFEGDAGGASITSDPIGLVCGASCTGSFASGTQITLTPTAGANTVFGGWSGLCYGEIACTFSIVATTSLTATFNSTLPASPDDSTSISTGIVASSSNDEGANTDTADESSTQQASTVSAGHVLIAAVQIAGAAADNDLVKLYNPTAVAVDMSGWKLHKRSASGTDYSLKTFPTGSVIGAGQSFTWANSENGFSETIGADVSSTETLSADNSIALLDAAGNVIDAVAWGTATGQYGEGPPYPTSPVANQTLSRRSSGGAVADTDNNANDFVIQ